ncbi:MAG TPA: DUF4288 domain-containing protein [Ohtaekwangia sp.]
MYSFLIILQAFLMNWYIAKIVFGISAENQEKKQFDEQLRLISADCQEEALLKARMIGLAEEDSFLNDRNQHVQWEFINVPELIPLKDLEDGMELYSNIREMAEAKSYINFVHRRAVELQLNTSSVN